MTLTAVTDGNAVHLVPALDTILHSCSEKCPCKPDKDDTSKKPVYTHHVKAYSHR